jgi:succinate-acetate transporter protein
MVYFEVYVMTSFFFLLFIYLFIYFILLAFCSLASKNGLFEVRSYYELLIRKNDPTFMRNSI